MGLEPDTGIPADRAVCIHAKVVTDATNMAEPRSWTAERLMFRISQFTAIAVMGNASSQIEATEAVVDRKPL